MYILYSLAAALVCMIIYRTAHRSIDSMVAGIERPWLKRSLGFTLKTLALLTTVSFALLSIFVFAMLASGKNGKNKWA